jgi:hypothetical protein
VTVVVIVSDLAIEMEIEHQVVTEMGIELLVTVMENKNHLEDVINT